jgi:hypothetical protein
MSKIFDLKVQIIEARAKRDLAQKKRLMNELELLQSKQKIKTVKEAYGQMADSP